MMTLRTLLRAGFVFGATMYVVALSLFVAFDGASQLTFDRALGIFGLTGLAAVGYAVVLRIARRNFRSDAAFGGRRDAVAAALALVLLLFASVLTQGAPVWLRLALTLSSGIAGALAAHFPWLQRRDAGMATTVSDA